MSYDDLLLAGLGLGFAVFIVGILLGRVGRGELERKVDLQAGRITELSGQNEALNKQLEQAAETQRTLDKSAKTLEKRLKDLKGQSAAQRLEYEQLERADTERKQRLVQVTGVAETAQRDLSHLFSLLAEMDVAVVIGELNGSVQSLEAAAAGQGFELKKPFSQHLHAQDRAYAQERQDKAGKGVAQYGARRASDRRHLVIRSTSLRQPLTSLRADTGTRLTLVIPLTKSDTAQLELDERVKLGSLITHGIATQAALVWKHKKLVEKWREDLMELLVRRVGVISELLASWEYPTAAANHPSCEVETSAIGDLLKTLSWLGLFVATNETVRREIGWQNGVLSRQTGSSPLNYTWGGWPKVTILTALSDHGELFIIEELIVNAFKHGAGGTLVTFDIRAASKPGWVEMVVSNQVAPDAPIQESRPYGGRNLITEACRQGGWEIEWPTHRGKLHEVKIRAPCKT